MTENRTKSTQSQDEIITPEDLGFEQRLGPARVSSLSVRGSVVALEPPLVAIVGTRQPDGDGLAMARSLASACAARGITVVSGGALGIDAAAHQGALEGRGRTVVVLPSGLDKPYPLRHRAMYARLVERGGALVSMFPAETPPTRWTFPRRNELLAALCDVLVLVQAPQSSGALLAATFAKKIGRRVLVVPASPGDRRGAGCLAMLRGGAMLCERPDDLFDAIDRGDGPLIDARPAPRVGAREAPARASRTRTRVPAREARTREEKVSPTLSLPLPPLDEAQSACVRALDEHGALHPDNISERAALGSARTRAALITLTLLGLVSERSDGTYIRVRA
ncbi:MAG: DNA-processing protein DprA [Polyangiales bacterium]